MGDHRLNNDFREFEKDLLSFRQVSDLPNRDSDAKPPSMEFLVEDADKLPENLREFATAESMPDAPATAPDEAESMDVLLRELIDVVREIPAAVLEAMRSG